MVVSNIGFMSKNSSLQPVLRWAGGKRLLSKRITEHFPKTFGKYYEPFLGGAAVFLESLPERAALSDANPRLINFYKTLASNPIELINEANRLAKEYNLAGDFQSDIFAEYRRLFNSTDLGAIERAAVLLLLNRTCFNGLYRENRSGQFNVPHDKSKRKVALVDEANFFGVSDALRGADLLSADYTSSLRMARDGDLVYLDPPYYPVSRTSRFSDYSQNGFTEIDHLRLLDTASQLAKRGVVVIISNSNTEWVRTEYEKRGFELHSITARRSLASKVQSRGNEIEIIAKSGD